MDIIRVLSELFHNPDVKSALVGYGVTWGLDKIKGIVVNGNKEVSYEEQIYGVFRETFEAFYAEHELVFEESIVMEAFLRRFKKIADIAESEMDRTLIEGTIGLEMKENQLEDWTRHFYRVCSNPKYQWVYNRLSLPLADEKKEDKSKWMKKHMEDNICRIGNLVLETMPSMFKEISTELPERCWNDTCELIWELVYNAQTHGKAKECFIRINRNAITIVDDGLKYDPRMMKEEVSKRGGCLTLVHYERDYPWVCISWSYIGNCNHFVLMFMKDVFDVNSMSEIVVPNMVRRRDTFYFKYPNGRFKYYYVDMEETRKRSGGRLFGPMSMTFDVLQELRNIEPEFENSKVYIGFPNTRETDYKAMYEKFIEVLPNISGTMEVVVIDAEADMSIEA
ncbi:MAG: hypothetical protein IJ418_11905 [Clostridia bacterium]|nr:hypothetical protein [Clostridia bacterium]